MTYEYNMSDVNILKTINCGFWNILAVKLANNEFITNGGDTETIEWSKRGPKVINCLKNMLNICDLVVTVENDKFCEILEDMDFNISGILYLETKADTKIIVDDTEYLQVYDGIAIYYRKDKLELISVSAPKINASDVYLCNGSDQYIWCTFYHKQYQVEINICGAHLSSGENIEKEKRRATKMEQILKEASIKTNAVILLDSNSSWRTEAVYKEANVMTMGDIIEKYGYENLIQDSGNECFKLRHAQGDQKNKYGHLMFDTIDKILTQLNGYEINNTFGFTKYPNCLKSLLEEWRSNLKKREIFKHFSTNYNNFRNKLDYEPIDWENDLIDNNIFNRWSGDMNQNEVSGLAACLGYESEIYSDPDEEVRDILKHLYPNQEAPSDHPPISATVYLK